MNQSEEMKRLETDLAKDETLHKALEETCRRIAESGDANNDIEVIVKAAAELGYTITPEDAERRQAGSEELDLDELNTVTGGVQSDRGEWSDDDKGHDGWCITAWHCNTVTLHTETETKQIKCFSNYMCFYVYHFSSK